MYDIFFKFCQFYVLLYFVLVHMDNITIDSTFINSII